MRKLLATAAVAALALTAVHLAQATTFSLRTIYVASGVYDSGDAVNVGTATSVHCTNLSGKIATVKVSFYGPGGAFEGTAGPFDITNLSTQTFSTHNTFFSETSASTGAINQGVLNLSSTESAVFCSAMLIDAAGGPGAANVPEGIALHMVRYNPHPGTVE